MLVLLGLKSIQNGDSTACMVKAGQWDTHCLVCFDFNDDSGTGDAMAAVPYGYCVDMSA